MTPDRPQTHHCTQVERLALIAAATDTTRDAVERIESALAVLDRDVRQVLTGEGAVQANCESCKTQIKAMWGVLGILFLGGFGTLLTIVLTNIGGK